MARSIYLEEQRMPTLDDVLDVNEAHAVYERSMSDGFNQIPTLLDLNTATEDDIVEENGLAGRQGSSLHFDDSMTQSALFQGGETLASQGDLMSDEVARAVVNGVSSSEEEDEVIGDNLVFVPDSSDDDNEEEVEREIQFDSSDSDSDSSEEVDGVDHDEFDFMRKQEEKMVSLEDGPNNEGRPGNGDGKADFERVASLSSSDGEEKPANVVEDDNSGSEESTIIVGPQEGGGDQLLGGDPGPGGSIGDCGSKNQEKKICSISNSESESGSVPVIDIDPEVDAAFKGFKSRKQEP